MELEVNRMIGFDPFLPTGNNMWLWRVSQTKIVKCGVLQGSTFGAFAFSDLY